MTPREKALAKRRSYQETIEAIRMDRDLSVEAKRRKIADAYTKASAALAALRREETTGTDAERRKLARRLFGVRVSGEATATERTLARMDLRHAFEIAERAEPVEKLVDLIDRAVLVGDTPLMRASGAVGFARGWQGAVDRFRDALDESERADLDRLLAGGPSLGERFADSMIFAVEEPPEAREARMLGEPAAVGL